MAYCIPHSTYAVTREPRGVPHGTLAPEHVLSGGPILVTCALHDRGAEVYDTTVGELQRLAIGQNITCLSGDYRYSVEREG